MAHEMRITLRILELKGGGFILAEESMGDDGVEFDATQAVSSINEACGAVQNRLQTWNNECKMLKLRQSQEDDHSAMVIEHPRKWWRAIK